MAIEQFRMTKPAPIVWPNLVTPRPENPKLKTKPRFEVTFLFTRDHPDWAAMEQMMVKQCHAEFGEAGMGGRKYPAKDGTAEADAAQRKDPPRDREFLRGKIMFQPHGLVLNAKGDPVPPPRLVAVVNDAYRRFEPAERALAREYFYSGVMAIGTFGFAAYQGFGGGVSAYLNEILSLNFGDRIQTGASDEDRYGDVRQYVGHVGQSTSYNPTAVHSIV